MSIISRVHTRTVGELIRTYLVAWFERCHLVVRCRNSRGRMAELKDGEQVRRIRMFRVVNSSSYFCKCVIGCSPVTLLCVQA